MNAAPTELPRSQVIAIWVIVALLCAIFTWYLYQHIEIVENTIKSQGSEEVRSEPYLAAKYLLQTYDVEVELHDDYRLLFASSENRIVPASNDAVVLTDGQIALSDKLATQLLSWIEQGGHLIIALNDDDLTHEFRANALVKKLALGVEWLTFDDEAPIIGGIESTPITTSDEAKIEVMLESSYSIEFVDNGDIAYSSGTEDSMTFVEITRGDGLISVMTETYIWNNNQISNQQNVVLLRDMLDEKTKVYFFTSKELPHWFTLLYDFAPYFIWIGALLVALLMWHSAVRFGPIQDKQAYQHTSFSKHIEAAGEFYWRTGQQQELLNSLRQSLLFALHKKRPRLTNADADEISQALSKICGWEEATVRELLYSEQTLNEAQFSKWIAGLQSLRKMI